MSSKQAEDALKKLVALGYTKTKAQKALKECGNGFAQAKQWLERLKEEEEKKAHEAELALKAQQNAEEAKKLAARKREESARSATEPEDLLAVRKHPCVAQYGNCRYGQSCMMKFMPADTCINYVVGTCIFGDVCRNRHAINGEDIRKLMGVADDHKEYYQLPNGDLVEVTVGRNGKTAESATVYANEYGMDMPAAPIPEPSAFSGDAGSVPTYSEPLADHGYDIWGTGAPYTSGNPVSMPPPMGPIGSPLQPTPFLNKVLAAPKDSPTPAMKVVVPAAPASSPPHAAAPGKRHPCIVQMGECRFGSTCHHADLPGDICVHWLNARCRNVGGQCRFRHELPGGPSPITMPASSNTVHSPHFGATASPTLFADPMWSAQMTPFGSGKIGAAALVDVGRPGSSIANGGGGEGWTRAFDAPSREETARRAGAEFIATRLQPELQEAQQQPGGKWRQMTTSPQTAATPAELLLSSPALPPPSSQAGETSAEALAFQALHEVFPDVMPDLILAALRKTGNDRHLVAQVIADATPANIERILQAAQEEELSAAKSLVLVTLHSMLPSMEPASLEKILADSNGDFAEAYRIAAITTEHLVASNIDCRWGGTTRDAAGRETRYTPADQMKLDRLGGMFPEHEHFVIESAFERANRVTADAIALLNRLNGDLEWVARLREEWGQKAVTKSMSKPAAPPATDNDSFTVTSGGAGSVQADPTPKTPLLSSMDLYHQTKQEAADHSDWRRVRQEAYMANAARAQCVGLALAAYSRGQHDVGRNLIRKAQEHKRSYERLNMLAMHALERERSSTSVHGISVLDLHGFHVTEAIDVLTRRLEQCQRNGIEKLRVIIGHGSHSKAGHSVIYPRVHALLKEHPMVHIKSVKPAEITVSIEHPH